MLSDERHWFGRDAWWHEYTHKTISARYYEGMGGTFDNTSITIEAGEFYDEDIEHENSQETVCTVLYKDGTVNWKWTANLSTPYKVVNPGVDDTLQYNNGTALASIGTAKFALYWVYIVNDPVDPVHIVIGQAEYNTIAAARLASSADLSLGTLPSVEMKLIYKLIYKNVGGNPIYQEAQDFRSVSSLPAQYIATNHPNLTGLAWLDAAHSGTANTIAGFDATGLAIEYNTFAELNTAIADKTLVNEEDAITLDSLLTASAGVTIATGQNFTLGTTQWNSADKIDGTKIKDADYGDVTIDGAGDWDVGNAQTVTTNANLTGEVTSVGNATTITDGIAVTNWNLTTPTITTSLTTDSKTISEGEIGRLDGLAGIIVTDVTAVTDIEGTGLSIGGSTLNWSAASTDLTDTTDITYNADSSGGELGGTIASPTINDSIAVSSWNLTTPTITTSLTTDGKTITEAEIGRLDGLGGIIVTDVTSCTDLEGTLLSITAGVLNATEAQDLNAVLALGATATTNIIANANLSVGNATTTAGVLTLLEDEDDGSNFASFMVPTLAANTVYTLPPAIGGAGEVLTDAGGDGTLSWAAGGGAETDPIVGAVTGIVKADGASNISAATSNTDYLPPVAPILNNGEISAGYIDFLEDSDNGTDYVRLLGPPSTDTLTINLGIVAGIVTTDVTACNDLEGTSLSITTGTLNVDDDFLKLGGDVATAGTYDFGSANVVLEVPNAAAPTTDATGEMAVDTDLITQGMLQVYLASAIANVVATTDVPGDDEVPTYDLAGGTIQWEASGGGGVSFGAEDQIPITNATTDDFDYSSSLTFDGTTLTTAGQIKFPASQSASSDPHTQDDYEEGTHTTTLTCGTSGTITLDGGSNGLAYTKVGRRVTLHGGLFVTSVSSPTGSLILSLPFVVTNLGDSGELAPGLIGYNGINAIGSGGALYSLTVVSTSTTLILELTTTGFLNDVSNHIKGGTEIKIGLSYISE